MKSGTAVQDRIQLRFERYHQNNPHIYTAIVALARQMKASGKKFYGIAGLYEKLRWDFNLHSTVMFGLPNNYRSRYARMVMANEPDLYNFFDVKQLDAEKAA